MLRQLACAAALSIVGVSLVAPPGQAHAQDRAKASFRFEEGKKALAKGRVDEAVTALGEAHEVLRTPSTALAFAQALEKKGRLAEALVVAKDGVAIAKVPKETFTVMKARADLDALVTALDKRVPRIDEEPAAPGVGTTADPPPETAAATASPPADAEKPSGPLAGASPAPQSHNGAVVAALVGFTGFAFGAGLGVGGFLVSRARLEELEGACSEGECQPHAAGAYRDASATRIVALAAFGVAGAGLVTGIVGAVVASQNSAAKTATSPRIRFHLGATSVSVDGSF